MAPTSAATPGAAAPAPKGARTAPAANAARAPEPERPAAPAATQAAASAAGGVDFDELESEVDQLLTRASAVNSSLDTLRQQQARQGLGLRGDIASRQESMNLNLTRAREAVQQKNAARLQRFKALAEGDVEALERFLGR